MDASEKHLAHPSLDEVDAVIDIARLTLAGKTELVFLHRSGREKLCTTGPL